MKSQNLFISVHVLLQLSRNYRHHLMKVCSIFQSSTFDLSLWNHQSIHSMLPLSFSHVSYCTKYLAVFSTLNHASHSYCFHSQKGNFPTSKSIQRSLICMYLFEGVAFINQFNSRITSLVRSSLANHQFRNYFTISSKYFDMLCYLK